MTKLNQAPTSSQEGPDEELAQEEEKKSKRNEFARLIEDSFRKTKKKLSPGEKIRGEILSLGKEDVFVSTGTIHDGIVSKKELLDPEGKCSYQVGDVLDLYVTQVRGSEIYLSTKATGKNISDNLEDAFDMMLPVEGRVAEVCKGGFRVSIMGKLAFCPISQMDQRRIENSEEYVGQKFEFIITQFSEGGRNIVVSRRRFLDEQKGHSESAFAENHRIGEVLHGTISRLEKFGAFVTLENGLEGLIHISELAWSRVGDPQEVVKVGQVVSAKILSFEEKDGHLKISLSLKQTESKPDPWAEVPYKYPVGKTVKGKVERKEPYGLFVQIEDGITGLLPKSRALEDSQFHYDRIKVKDEIVVQIEEIKMDERRISLGPPKDAGRDDWKEFNQKSSTSLGTLGDQFRHLFDKKKS